MAAQLTEIHEHLSFYEYTEIDALNASSIKPWIVSPKHAKWIKDNPYDTNALMLGRLVHSYILEDDFNDNYACLKDDDIIQKVLDKQPDLKKPRASKKYKELYSEWEDQNKNKILFKYDDMQTVQKASQVIKERLLKRSIDFKSLDKELTLVWHDEELGCLCKARLDMFDRKKGLIYDIKTTTKRPDKRAVESQIEQYRYDMQYAWYIRACKACGLCDSPYMNFIFVQLQDEFDVTFAEPSDEMYERAEKDIGSAIHTMNECNKTNNYPGVCPDPIVVMPPAWSMSSDHEIIHED